MQSAITNVKNFATDIKKFVGEEHVSLLQQCLDKVREVGNDAAYELKIEFKNDREIPEKLFELVSIIVHELITKKKTIDQVISRHKDVRQKKLEKRS